MFFATTLSLLLWLIATKAEAHSQVIRDSDQCSIMAYLTGGYDAPAILYAFEHCGRNGSIVFVDESYNIHSVMNTTGLRNVKISLRGSLTVVQTSVAQFIN
jgi:galacturan 1,4-alpha-galacturonidase